MHARIISLICLTALNFFLPLFASNQEAKNIQADTVLEMLPVNESTKSYFDTLPSELIRKIAALVFKEPNIANLFATLSTEDKPEKLFRNIILVNAAQLLSPRIHPDEPTILALPAIKIDEIAHYLLESIEGPNLVLDENQALIVLKYILIDTSGANDLSSRIILFKNRYLASKEIPKTRALARYFDQEALRKCLLGFCCAVITVGVCAGILYLIIEAAHNQPASAPAQAPAPRPPCGFNFQFAFSFC